MDFIVHAIGKEPPTDFAIDYNGKAVGAIGYVTQTEVSRVSAEVSYWLGESLWNLGIAMQVLTAFVDHIFKNTDIIHLYANVFEGNTTSMRVLEKAGFMPAGILHRAAIKNGRINRHLFLRVPSANTVICLTLAQPDVISRQRC